jgi:trehalose 2-sulfotransferase
VPQSRQNGSMSVNFSYFLCCSPRTGSYLLAEALESTRIAGRPREFFDPNFDKRLLQSLGATEDREYLEKVLAIGTTPNGVFGVKLHWHQFEHLIAKLRLIQGDGSSDLELLRRTFPDLHYIYLTRRDKVRQAVSYYRAVQTDVWRIRPNPDANANREQRPLAALFDVESIDRYIALLSEHEARWRRHFERVGVVPMEVVYEDFPRAYESTVLAVLRNLGIPIPEGLIIAPPQLQKQADEISEDWVNRYLERKSKTRAVPRRLNPSYFISTTPRSGSTLLAEALESTRIAGKPKEFFDPHHEKLWLQSLGIAADSEYVEKILATGSTPNGVFGAKVHWHQFEHLTAKLRSIQDGSSSDLELLRRTFPDLRYVYLTRRDKVRQAVSYYRAIQTGVWWSIRPDAHQKPATPAPAPGPPPPFDFEQIDHWVTRLTSFESRWRRHFETLRVEPFQVVYEEFVESYEATVLALLRYLELPITEGVRVTPPRLRKQADDVSEEWVQRYHELKRPTGVVRRRVDLSYFIACTPRTGSTLLAEALELTRIAGKPKEYFEPSREKQWLEQLKVSADSDYFESILSAGTTPNGVFGAKVHWHQFTHLATKFREIRGAGLPDLEHLRGTFPGLRFVFLTRRDKVRQAVSYYRAIQTGVWWSIRPDAIANRPTPERPPVVAPLFDFEHIDHWVRRLAEFESEWRRYFLSLGVKPFEVAYEDFVETYESTVLAILGDLEIPISEGQRVAPPRLQKMADEVSEDWVCLYRKLKRT